MTEDEAKKKWCPFVRAQNFQPDGSQNPAVNRPEGNFDCIGSSCMAWRELHPRETREDHSGAPAFMAERAVKTGRIVRREGPSGSYGKLILDAVGFCGLAGKP